MFKLQFETSNAAFQSGDDVGSTTINRFEVDNVVRIAFQRFMDGENHGVVTDINGNTIGSFELTED